MRIVFLLELDNLPVIDAFVIPCCNKKIFYNAAKQNKVNKGESINRSAWQIKLTLVSSKFLLLAFNLGKNKKRLLTNI